MKNICCIVIPVYKDKPNEVELASFKQALSILKRYSIYLITHKKLDLNIYQKIAQESNIDIKTEYFESTYFSGIQGYNNLLLSPSIYKRFTNYTFMLIYQLDAWVFKDELLTWCSSNYSYIGAPWATTSENETFLNFWGVGNGGFSLRKIKDHIKVLNSFRFIESPKDILVEIIRRKTWREIFRGLLKLPLRILWNNNTHHLLSKYSHNEDVFWSQVASSKFKWFKLASVNEAILFSFETFPEECFKITNNILPFGCHAWEKYNKSFWEEYMI